MSLKFQGAIDKIWYCDDGKNRFNPNQRRIRVRYSAGLETSPTSYMWQLIPFLYGNITLFRRSGRSGSETRLFIVSCPNQRQMRVWYLAGFVPLPDLQYVMTICQLEMVLDYFRIKKI